MTCPSSATWTSAYGIWSHDEVNSSSASEQRVAIVTGANRGLGRALAGELARNGVTVVLTARRLPDAEAAAEALARDGLSVQACEADVAHPASVNRMFADVEREYGRLDVLINNAAVAIDRGARPSHADLEMITATLSTNLLGTWRCCIQAVRLMRMHRYGRIVNVSSHMASLTGTNDATSPAYRVSKSGVNQLTRVLAAETRNENILVNAASPGTVNTRMSNGDPQFTPQQAAEEMVWLACLPDDGPTGQFFHGHEPVDW